MNRVKFFIVSLALLLSPPVLSSGLKPFFEESLATITKAREGEPFLLVLWSVDCPPCIKELDLLRQVSVDYPELTFSLISTDTPDTAPEARRILASHGLENADVWIFAHDYAERLRYRIDPDWFGELPRAYFYAADHQRLGVSGALEKEVLVEWAESVRKSGM